MSFTQRLNQNQQGWIKNLEGKGKGGDLYLRVAQLMEHAYKVFPFANWNLHVNIKSYYTRKTSNATK